MSHVSPRLACLASLLSLASLAGPVVGQNPAVEKVKIPTIDGVELRGWFYKSAKQNAPTVIVFHALGEHSQVVGWKALAEALQPNYSVMLFDFRGHGESKSVIPELFWELPPNKGAGKPTGNKDTIEFKSFDKGYYSVLINDIAAVKGFLDRKNDTGACNTSNTILIGAETGATLGAIWLNSEFARYKLIVNAFGAKTELNPEGKDVVAAIWLSASPNLGTRRVHLDQVLESSGKHAATPMVFMYSDGDKEGATQAKLLEKSIKSATAKDQKRYAFTGAVPLKGQAKLKGVGLLELKSVGADQLIEDWIGKVVADKDREWTEREFRKSHYVWRPTALATPIVAKPAGEANMFYSKYDEFIR